jgi:CHASE1-domain containing sensor protein
MLDAKTRKTAPDPELSKPHSQSLPPRSHLLIRSLFRLLFQKGDSPWSLLAAGLLITVAITLFMKAHVDQNAEKEFNHQSREIQFAIAERLHDQARILKSGVALFEASDNVTLRKWTAFTRYLAIEKELHGFLGLGFALHIKPAELTGHVQQIRSEGFPDYRIVPEGVRDEYSSVIHIEPPFSGTMHSFGFNMLTDPVRRSAMEQARDTNLATLSGIVPLHLESGSKAISGVLMYLPVYHKRMPIDTVEQRRTAIHGWVFHPCRMDDMMKGILGNVILEEARQLRFQVYDGASPSPQNKLYECVPPNEQNLAVDTRFTRQFPLIFKAD